MGLGGFSGFDIAAVVVIGVSGLMGWARGFTREVTTVIAFVLAVVAAVWGLRYSAPIAQHLIHTVWMADTAAAVLTFIVVYIVLRMIGGAVTRQVQHTAVLSSLDRVLGFGVGLVRALAILGAFALMINAATPPERMPAWISQARLWPLADKAGEALKMFAPEGLKVAHSVAADPQDPGDRGSDADQRKSLDDLVEKSR